MGGQRAQLLADCALDPDNHREDQLPLYMRYQTMHDRAFHKCLDQLLKLRVERRKQEIGFESQKQKEAQEARRQSTENRKQDLHKFALMTAQAKLDCQALQNSRVMEASEPRTERSAASRITEAGKLT